jgi:hypothetical protein
MRLSGFSVARNAIDLDYPIAEAIRSVLPIVDEFVVALGDSYDNTTAVVRSIGDPKLVIIERVWDPHLFDHGAILAHETNAALDACTGDWCIYLQADEVIHEKFLPVIVEACRKYRERKEVEGFLLSYAHFWGDYRHFQKSRNWYRHEIRVVRNGTGVRSWKSAQGFRIDGRKMNVIQIPAEVYHYGWVRNPAKMKKKRIAHDSLHHDRAWVEEEHGGGREAEPFDYGSSKHLAVFRGTHPSVMKERIAAKDWDLDEGSPARHEHDSLRVRILSSLERFLGVRFGEYKNYVLLERDSVGAKHAEREK